MKPPKIGSKIDSVLGHLLGGNSLNRFEAEKLLHDHCLNSTISILANQYGIKVSRQLEAVRGYQGKRTYCNRYWLDVEERLRVIDMLYFYPYQ